MNIGIFSKFEMAGGSEFRCVELANAIVRYTGNWATILVEGNKFPSELEKRRDSRVKVELRSVERPELFYDMDHILVVNTDSNCYTTADYWRGKYVDKHGNKRHSTEFNLKRFKGMTFLFNFIVSPSRHLVQLENDCPNLRIITTNDRFYKELASKDKLAPVRHLPRMILESPIDTGAISTHKLPSPIIRIGKHSQSLGSKWNVEQKDVILELNEKFRGILYWDFMGCSDEFSKAMDGIENVICRKTFAMPVIDYLMNIDIFLFYIDWKRQEPWARVVGEALMSGCPVLATDTDGGNRMQVVQGSNGFLCKSKEEFKNCLSLLIEEPRLLERMKKNALIYSRFFTSEYIIKKLMDFIK